MEVYLMYQHEASDFSIKDTVSCCWVCYGADSSSSTRLLHDQWWVGCVGGGGELFSGSEIRVVAVMNVTSHNPRVDDK
jgi:hypothetical protein